MKKIYHSKSNNVPLEQLDKDRQFIFEQFPGCEYIQYIKGEKYDQTKLYKCDICIVSTPNHTDVIGKGLVSEIGWCLENKVPVLQILDYEGLELVFIKGIQVIDEHSWTNTALIHRGNIASYLENT